MKKNFVFLALFAFSLSFVACSTTDQDETAQLYDTVACDACEEPEKRKD